MKFFLPLLLAIFLIGCTTSTHQSTEGPHSEDIALHHHMAPITSEIQFIQEMIPHHQEAVDSSEYLLTQTNNSDLQQFLRGVIELQNLEIEMMQEWYQDWYSAPYIDLGNYMPMMPNLEGLEISEQERLYIEGMIEHHLGAIKMANELLELDPTKPELVQFAQDIIRVQSQEISELRSFLD